MKMEIVIRQMRKEDADQLEELQKTVFPFLSAAELMSAKHFAHHTTLFPEGQFVAVKGDKVVASTSSIRYNFDPNHPEEHRFLEMFDEGYFGTHNPSGEWLYGMDIAVLPEFRGNGIARLLYRARQQTVHQLGLKGQVTVGMLNGYIQFANTLSIDEYYAQLITGKLNDPTVSAQKKIGFKIAGLIKDYLTDPTCGNAGALLVLDANSIV